MMAGRKGFTLIELLVVIAIIAILAAMLFPVFARARESARKIQCLSNVKNIATAVQMYFADYDKLVPEEHRQEVLDGIQEHCGGEGWNGIQTEANPYLRWPVVFDEYVKNRDVWRCPSATISKKFGIVNPRGGDWWAVVKANQDAWGCYAMGPCDSPFPAGWGGTVTDSFAQQMCAVETNAATIAEGAFVQTVATIDWYELKSSEIGDAAKFVVCGDGGMQNAIWSAQLLAYPEICKLACPACWYPDCAGSCVNWENCSWSQSCGAGDIRFLTDLEFRKKNARPRHLGGSNIGFADGHAAWMPSESILNNSVDWGGYRGDDPNRDYAITGGVGYCGRPTLK